MTLLFVLLCMCWNAFAQVPDDPTWFAGRIVASVEITAGEGSLGPDDLKPLLRAAQDVPLDPATLQLDLQTLFRVKPLAAIEAEVEPWPVYDPRVDDVTLGVKVRYVLYPAPKVAAVRVQGNRRVKSRRIASATRLGEGDAFYPGEDEVIVRDRILRGLVAEGFPDANVEVEAFPANAGDPFSLEIWIRIDEGPARVLADLTLDGLPDGLSSRRVRRWARRAGLKPGRPVAEDALTRSRYLIRQKMARVGAGPTADALLGSTITRSLTRARILPPGGWVEARVRTEDVMLDDGSVRVAIEIDAGRQLSLKTSGISQTDARRALAIDERLRMTRGFLEQAPERIQIHLAERGYRDARVRVQLDEHATHQQLIIDVRSGPRYRRRRFQIDGNVALSDNQLRTLLNQASPEVLRRRRLTEPAMVRGAQAIRDLYRSVGYERAKVTWSEPRIRRRVPLFSLDRSTRWLVPKLHVEEGVLTRLERVEIVGESPNVDLSPVDNALLTLRNGPYSPQGLQSIAQRIVEIHRNAGYLDAKTRVRTAPAGERVYNATIEVETGDRVLLRSFATRGNRRVSSRFLRRTVAPPLGQPLDARTLEDLRQRLYDLNMFGSVELTLVGDDAARDLIVELRERARHTVETGIGLASDQGVRALGRWTFRNLFAAADRIDTNALVGFRFGVGGGAIAPLSIFRTPEYRIGSNYTLPLSTVQEVTLSLVGQEEIQERNWRLLRRAVGFQWAYHPRRATLVQIRTRLEHRRLAGVDPGALLKTDVWTDPALRLPSAPSVDTRGRLVDQIEFVWLDDHRDNPLQPTRGVLGSTRVAFSPQLLQPTYAQHLRVPLLSAEARGAAVVPLGPLSLRVNAEGGHQRVIPLGNIASFDVDGAPARLAVPIEERYRLGGTGSLRGFRRDGVGPHQRSRPFDLTWPSGIGPIIGERLRLDDTRWVPTGGDTFARLSTDLLIPLPTLGLSDWQGYDLALFADVGQAWFLATSEATPEPPDGTPLLRFGIGTGLRVLTPVGPLQIDLAFNPQAQPRWREPLARLHLSLGTLF